MIDARGAVTVGLVLGALVLAGAGCRERSAKAPPEQTVVASATAGPTPGAVDLLKGAGWECLPDAEVSDGRVVIRGPVAIAINDFLLRLRLRGDFTLSALLEGEGELAGITLRNSLPPPQADPEWHATAPRVQLALRSQRPYFAVYDGSGSQPVHEFTATGAAAPGAVALTVRKAGGALALLVNDVEVSRTSALGPFVDGPLYVGANVSANSVVTIRELTITGAGSAGEIRVEESPLLSGRPERRAGESLRDLLAARGRLAGVGGIQPHQFRWDPAYRALVASEFSSIAPGGDFDWRAIHPAPNRYNFCNTDQFLAFARANGMQVDAKFLTWGNLDPEWLTAGKLSRAELVDVLHRHIETVVGRYRGQVAIWEVANEVLDYEYAKNGQMRDTVWSRGIGPEYVEMAFRWAREADPRAVLLINEVGVEGTDRKADGFFELVKGLRARGAPIDGVGLQTHWPTVGGRRQGPDMRAVAANMKRFEELGLAVYITEMDVPIQEPGTPELLAAQARVYREMLGACLAAPNCKGFTTWGAYDGVSWLRARPRFAGMTAPLLFDESFRPKPAYEAITGLLKSQ